MVLTKEYVMVFGSFQKVRHVKTGTIYFIVGTPDKFILEKTTEGAYAYQRYNESKSKIWIRCKTEMEDGRFVLEE